MPPDPSGICFGNMLKIKWWLPEIIGIICQDWRLYVCVTPIIVNRLNIFLDLFLVGTLYPVWSSTSKEKKYKDNLIRMSSVILLITRVDMFKWLLKQVSPPLVLLSVSDPNGFIKKGDFPYCDLPTRQAFNSKQRLQSAWQAGRVYLQQDQLQRCGQAPNPSQHRAPDSLCHRRSSHDRNLCFSVWGLPLEPRQ